MCFVSSEKVLAYMQCIFFYFHHSYFKIVVKTNKQKKNIFPLNQEHLPIKSKA